MIKLGIRSSIVKVVIDFLRDRKMLVKMNGQQWESFDLIGGGPQGSLVGQLLYIIASDDVAEEIPEEDQFKYIDDLLALEAINVEGKLVDYDVFQHVPSNLAPGQSFLPPDKFKTQRYNDHIFRWSNNNKMVIKQEKSNYMMISRSKQPIGTRLNINGAVLDRKQSIVHLGIHMTDSLCWEKHISEICRKAYPRVRCYQSWSMLVSLQKTSLWFTAFIFTVWQSIALLRFTAHWAESKVTN